MISELTWASLIVIGIVAYHSGQSKWPKSTPPGCELPTKDCDVHSGGDLAAADKYGVLFKMMSLEKSWLNLPGGKKHKGVSLYIGQNNQLRGTATGSVRRGEYSN